MSKKLQLAPAEPLGCGACAYRGPCGGLTQQEFYGCLSACDTCGVESGQCDYVCPRKPGFWRAWAEVGGLSPERSRDIPGVAFAFPRYVPMIRHGYRRARSLECDVVALNTFETVTSLVEPVVSTTAALRSRFQLLPAASVLLVSVKQDAYVESFWQNRTPDKLRALAQLGVVAVTTPNFSLFDDAPRIHSVRNLWRILRAAEDLADAGIAPILHVNAVAVEDWRWWRDMLRENSSVTHVCKEFQTGLRDPIRAHLALNELRRLQESLGRALHPVIVGGSRFAQKIAEFFDGFTLVDSIPFMATVKRKRIVVRGNSVEQVDHPTLGDETLDRLLATNLRLHREVLTSACSRQIDGLDDDFEDAPF